MRSKAIQSAEFALDERPDVFITVKGRMALIPSMDELLSRRGAKGLQTTLDEMTHHHFMMHGYDWRYAGGTIKTHNRLYFVHFGGTAVQADVHHLGRYDQAVNFLMDYARTGRPNDALRRMR